MENALDSRDLTPGLSTDEHLFNLKYTLAYGLNKMVKRSGYGTFLVYGIDARKESIGENDPLLW